MWVWCVVIRKNDELGREETWDRCGRSRFGDWVRSVGKRCNSSQNNGSEGSHVGCTFNLDHLGGLEQWEFLLVGDVAGEEPACDNTWCVEGSVSVNLLTSRGQVLKAFPLVPILSAWRIVKVFDHIRISLVDQCGVGEQQCTIDSTILWESGVSNLKIGAVCPAGIKRCKYRLGRSVVFSGHVGSLAQD